MAAVAVDYSDDFDRIVSMPMREISRDRGERLARELSPMLLSEEGKRHPEWKNGLNWLQALAIDEAVEADGAYLQLPVGSGKTLLTWLFPYIFQARRPVLVVPESLIEKTQIEFQTCARYWVRPQARPKIVGLKSLTQESNVDWLRRYNADLYLLDEVDMLKNQDSSMVKRLARDIDARNVRTIAMSGTGGRFSIKDISHLLIWALKENAPVPLDYNEIEWWADALDEKQKWRGPGKGQRRRCAPGVLLDLAHLTHKDDPELDELLKPENELGLARATFRKRLTHTRGCIISDTDSCDKALAVELFRAPDDKRIELAFRGFRGMGETPSGDVIVDAIELWALERAIGEGHCPRWVDPPPDWYTDARKEYSRLCMKVIRDSAWSDDPKDTPKAVRRQFGNHPIVREWDRALERVKAGEWVGERETVWHSMSVVEAAADWAEDNHGVVWTQSIAFGRALAKLTGMSFYGAEGKDGRGRNVEHDNGKRSIVCSVASNSRGRNLQDRWSNALIVGGVQSARANEQLWGRHHRFGQKYDVYIDIMLASGGSLYSFERALQEARFVHQTQGHRQKLLRAKKQDPIARAKLLPTGTSRWSFATPETQKKARRKVA